MSHLIMSHDEPFSDASSSDASSSDASPSENKSADSSLSKNKLYNAPMTTPADKSIDMVARDYNYVNNDNYSSHDITDITESSDGGSAESLWLYSKSKTDKQRMQILLNEQILLNNWLKKCRIYRAAAYDASRHYKNWDNVLGYVPIVLAALLTVAAGYEFLYTSQIIVKLVEFIVLIVITIMKTLHAFLKLSKKGEIMKHINDRLASLQLQIEIYLAQSSQPIIPPVEFIGLMYRDITAIVKETNDMPSIIMNKYANALLELETIKLVDQV